MAGRAVFRKLSAKIGSAEAKAHLYGDSKIQKTYGRETSLVSVSVEKLTGALAKQNTGYEINPNDAFSRARIDRAKTYQESGAKLTPPVVGIYEKNISIENGRHRIQAAKERGDKKIILEVEKSQVGLFRKIK